MDPPATVLSIRQALERTSDATRQRASLALTPPTGVPKLVRGGTPRIRTLPGRSWHPYAAHDVAVELSLFVIHN
jgi:hypothetical protein